MILTLDIGNTRIVLGLFDSNGNVQKLHQIRTIKNASAYEYASDFEKAFELSEVKKEEIKEVIICSSVPEINVTISKAIKIILNIDSFIIDSNIKSNINIDKAYKNLIGADLVVSAIAAKANYDLPAIIIDMGTATTITVLDKDSNFLGGSIIPGIKISKEALIENASLLPNVDLVNPRNTVSLDTIDCIKSGIVYGNACLIDGMIDRVIKELNIKPKSIIATGGNSKYIIPYCQKEIIQDNKLLIRGMYEIWKMNKS